MLHSARDSLLILAIWAASGGSRAAEQTQDTPSPLGAEPLGAGYVIELLVGLAVVLTAVFLLAWLLRRMGHFSGSMGGSMKVLGGLSVGQRERVVLIQVGETQLLIGVAPGSVQRLHQLDEPLRPPEAATGRGAEPGFAERLASVLRQGRRA
ncbi:MAG: flagellar biosynthetic protein FliO [Chromatiales bacterium]|jgi:flagellar protein FliO/FliZ